VTANRLRWITIGLFAVALVCSAIAGGRGGPFWAGSFFFFLVGVGSFLQYRRRLRAEQDRSRVSDREEKTSG